MAFWMDMRVNGWTRICGWGGEVLLLVVITSRFGYFFLKCCDVIGEKTLTANWRFSARMGEGGWDERTSAVVKTFTVFGNPSEWNLRNVTSKRKVTPSPHFSFVTWLSRCEHVIKGVLVAAPDMSCGFFVRGPKSRTIDYPSHHLQTLNDDNV